jgi:hypothetical protein
MYIGLYVKYPLLLSYINKTSIFSTAFRKTPSSNFMNIRPVEAELLHSEGQTDKHDEANTCFSQFC